MELEVRQLEDGGGGGGGWHNGLWAKDGGQVQRQHISYPNPLPG